MAVGKWKPVIIDSGIIPDGFEGLVGVEELVVHNNGYLQNETFRSRKSKKRKNYSIGGMKKKHKMSNAELPEGKEDFNEDDLSFLNEMKSWSCYGIHNEILFALYKKKFFEPTTIQSKCLGPAICGQLDILGAAETGSGKTLAFGIPIVNGILTLKSQNQDDNINTVILKKKSDGKESTWDNFNDSLGYGKVKNQTTIKKKNQLYALILTPTRELAVQVKDHLTDICKYTNIKVALVVGGLAHEKQERILNSRPEIVVGTPGRLWELIVNRNIHLQSIELIKYLAIDETDRMLEKGHFLELQQLLEKINLNEKHKKVRQNFIFSATLTIVHDPPSYLKGKRKKRITPGQKLQDLINQIGVTNPKIVDITSCQVTAENLIEYKIFCKFEEKDYYLYHFLKIHFGRAIIFCNSISCVKRLANLLSLLSLKPLPLHANMEQKQRLKNLDKFREHESSLLLATDVAARGLDIPNVNYVIHYQVPKTAETYVHRSGRTARVHSVGITLLLVEPQEHNAYNKLKHTLGRGGFFSIQRMLLKQLQHNFELFNFYNTEKDIEDFNVDIDAITHIKKIIHLARDIDQISLVIKKENSQTSWYQKAIKDMDLIIDKEEMPKKLGDEAESKIKRELHIKKKKLNELLGKKILPKCLSSKFAYINYERNAPMFNIRRDQLKIPGAFVLRKIPSLALFNTSD